MSELFDSSVPLTGNLAKVHCLLVIEQRLRAEDKVNILDVGCIGPQPLDFWRPLLDRYAERFTLHGIDVHGIDRGQQVVRENGWNNVRLMEGSGYNLSTGFDPACFDLVIATQVLEHMRHWERFFMEARAVLKPGGLLIVTFDSGDFTRAASIVDLGKNFVKRFLATVFGGERHWDFPLRSKDVEKAAAATGFDMVERKFFNVHPLKHLHNHLTAAERKNLFLRSWYDFEKSINEDKALMMSAKSYFFGVYYAFRKR